MRNQNLHPCPRCGSERVKLCRELVWVYAGCLDCDTEGRHFDVRKKHNDRWAADAAWDAWNNGELEP